MHYIITITNAHTPFTENDSQIGHASIAKINQKVIAFLLNRTDLKKGHTPFTETGGQKGHPSFTEP